MTSCANSDPLIFLTAEIASVMYQTDNASG